MGRWLSNLLGSVLGFRMDIYNFVSLAGLFLLTGLGWLFSSNRRQMNWRCLGWGVGIQLILGLIVFRSPGSRSVFIWLNDVVLKLLGAARTGQEFLFGPLAVGPGEVGPQGEESPGFILAIQGLPIIIFFAALMGLLYYWRIMPVVIRAFAWIFTRLMRISGAESLCAASNMFVGVESATTVQPYLDRMTRSELCTVLTAGMATVASSVLGLYVLFLNVNSILLGAVLTWLETARRRRSKTDSNKHRGIPIYLSIFNISLGLNQNLPR